MTQASQSFSLDAYRALVTTILDRGYMIRSFADADPAARHLILRHDVDMSLEAAMAMAAVEHKAGWRAIYFVLLRSEFYNPFTPTSRAALQAIRHMGHGVGLHFDAALYAPDRAALEHAAARECVLLEEMSDGPLEAISFHRPAHVLQGLAGDLAGLPHAYAPRFFCEMGYCSDSQGEWRHGAPLDHPAIAERRALQLLTHPIWWTTTSSENPRARLRRFLAERHAHLNRELAIHCRIHHPTTRTDKE